ncbi:hypothetical protein ACQKDY_09740 [Alteromonas macleodii]|uniref:hypothetical protein n=1 Tax=Alteromonas macleodii TaxID=28108 RepID=UPI003D07FC4A
MIIKYKSIKSARRERLFWDFLGFNTRISAKANRYKVELIAFDSLLGRANHG